MRLFALALAIAAALSAALGSGAATAQSRSPKALASLLDPAYTHVPGEMLVQYRRGASDDEKERALRRVGATFGEEVARGTARFDGGDLELVRLPPGQAVAAAMR